MILAASRLTSFRCCRPACMCVQHVAGCFASFASERCAEGRQPAALNPLWGAVAHLNRHGPFREHYTPSPRPCFFIPRIGCHTVQRSPVARCFPERFVRVLDTRPRMAEHVTPTPRSFTLSLLFCRVVLHESSPLSVLWLIALLFLADPVASCFHQFLWHNGSRKPLLPPCILFPFPPL